MTENSKIEKLGGQPCPMCFKKTLTLMEQEDEIPFFGKVHIFSMRCSNCNYNKSDIESSERKEPCKYTFEINGEEDLKVRVVKSSEATLKLPRIMSVRPGPASNGYVTNIEGVLNRAKDALERSKELSDEKKDKIAAIKLIKKINKIIFGSEKLKITIEDPSGNSAIISDKAVKTKLR
ncbi:MAG: ZPR1 zinc finger domain-containing protein [Nanoarchaeota archaeon]|nr:ZPR1 zinc finger domain-containing protein [Nanoarchaeota archaeon]